MYVIRLLSVHAQIPDQKVETIRYVTIRNNAPVIESATVSHQRDLLPGSVKMSVKAFDPEGTSLKYIYKAFFEGEEEVVQSGVLPESILTLKNGAYSFAVDVIDAEGNITTHALENTLLVSGVKNTEPIAGFVIDPDTYHYTTTDFSFISIFSCLCCSILFFNSIFYLVRLFLSYLMVYSLLSFYFSFIYKSEF